MTLRPFDRLRVAPSDVEGRQAQGHPEPSRRVALAERPLFVLALFIVLSILMTWPTALGLTRDIPSDLGDPVFVSGVLTWGSEHWLQLLGGDLSAATRFWTAPWLYPTTLTTALSEHFALHSLLTLPAYVVTRNIILCYNLLFLATFVLSGFGMYLFVRELTGRPLAAVVAGIAFAFPPYRFATLSHLQVLSSQWMPFALYGFRRYFAAAEGPGVRPAKPLAVGSLAVWAQNMSSGYYMVFFGPFLAIYVLVEMTAARLLRNVKVWAHMITAAVVAALLTMPFALPYLAVRRRSPEPRPIHELTYYSADLMGWLTASPTLKLWGHLQPFVKAEGFLFPGVTMLLLCTIGLWRGWRAWRSITIFSAITMVLSFWLSLGPEVQIRTQPTALPAIYPLAFNYVPGYDVARVPARFAMITLLAMSIAAGLALAALEHRRKWIVTICGGLLLAEGLAIPLPKNLAWTSTPNELVAPEARVYPEADAPAVYKYIRTLDHAVVAHLPFGAPEREIQYVYYAAMHRRRTVNGYSGAFPPAYVVRLPIMQNVVKNPRAANDQMILDGVTHVVVHSTAWTGGTGQALVALFDRSRGFERVGAFGDDVVYRLHY